MDQQFKGFSTIQDAYQFLQELGASSRLLQHVRLVGEAGEILIHQLQADNLSLDADFIRLGIVFHDVGKIIHPSELTEKGNQHESSGELLLLQHNVDPKLAKCCRSHAQWQNLDCGLEELVIALADNLWKGKRNQPLETLVIRAVSNLARRDYWELFVELDSCFERVAAAGDDRLLRSVC